jgi:TonB-dependent starch-binding outer membrane protein SusC
MIDFCVQKIRAGWTNFGRARRFAAVLALPMLALLPGSAVGQNTGTVTGAVVSAGGLAPLAGVQIVIEGTGIGGLSTNTGRFLLLNVPAGEVVVSVTMLGRVTVQQTVTVTAGAAAVVNFRMLETAISLDEIVVTGTAGQQQARALGTAVGSIQVAQAQALAPKDNLETMLGGAVPGLNVAYGGGAVGGGNNIRIRGAGSMVLSGQPLIYVDGVRVNRGGPGDDVRLGVGDQSPSSRLNDINPELIESIEVIKGPAAATLYGTEASNGVINIITKRGALGAPVFTLTTKMGQNWYQDPRKHWPGSFYTCTGLGNDDCVAGQIKEVNVFQNDFDKFGMVHFRNGLPAGTTGTVSGGTDKVRYHFTLGWDRDEGPVTNNNQDRLDARANLNWVPRDDLTIDFGFGAVRSELHTTTGRQPARITGFHWSCSGGSNGCETGLNNPSALDGPYRGYIAYLPDLYDELLDSGQKVDRNIYTLTATHRPFQWLTHRLVLGLDDVNTQGFLINLHSSGRVGISSRNGERRVEFRSTENLSFDYSGTATYKLRDGLELATSAGAQYYEMSSEFVEGRGRDFAVPGLSTISAGERRETSDGITGSKTVGVYVQEQVSWQNRLFLTGAVRGDDNSAFGADYDFVLYPKLSASWVISEESALEGIDWINELRLRAAWGKAGQQPDQFAAVRLYNPEPGFQGSGGLTPATFGNPNVEPEVGEEIEIGFDAGLFSDRLGVEVTYYNQKRKNALINVPVKPSTGFPGSQLRNIGEVENKGLEIGLNWDAYQSEDWGIEFGTSLHLNKNEVTDLGGLPPIPIFGRNFSTGWTGQRHIEGFPLGSIFLPKVVSADIVGTGLAARAVNVMCESGPIVLPGTRITRGGGPAVPCDSGETAPEVYMGATVPTREFDFNATVTLLQNTRLFVDFQYAGGHTMVDGITAASHLFFRNTKAIHEKTDPIFLGYDALGEVNQAGIFDASQLTLRSVSVSHTFSPETAARLGADRLNLTLSGQNLWKVWRATTEKFGHKIVDSEIRDSGSTSTSPGGISAYTQDGFPIFKRFLATVRVTF